MMIKMIGFADMTALSAICAAAAILVAPAHKRMRIWASDTTILYKRKEFLRYKMPAAAALMAKTAMISPAMAAVVVMMIPTSSWCSFAQLATLPTVCAITPAILASVGKKILPMAMDTPSMADCSWMAPPLALSFMVFAICFEAPSALSIALASVSKSLSDALTTARKPLIASVPAMLEAICAFSDCDKPLNFSRSSIIV